MSGNNKVEETSQYLDNMSFDKKYTQNAVEILVENEAENALVRQKPIATEAKQDDLIGNYTTRITEDSGYCYVGEAEPGADTSNAVWRISRIDSSGNELWATGDTDFTHIYDDILTISYT